MKITSHHISPLRPKADETLMSFLRRAQEDAGYSEDGFNSLLAGSTLSDSRCAERREFDWLSLSRFFNASPGELHALSERSMFYELGDASRRGLFQQRAPWMRAAGYGAYSPAALQDSEHWRKSWLGPAALVCNEHGTVLVRHCHECGRELSTMTWKRPAPVCPGCGAHLALGPVIPVDENLLGYAEQISMRYDFLTAATPVDRHNHELALFAVMWRTAKHLEQERFFDSFRVHFAECAGLGCYASGLDVGQLALRHAQCTVMAYLICRMDPTLVEHYWVMAESRSQLERADETILFKLAQFVEDYTGRKFPVPLTGFQTTISLASWTGWNSMPKAA
ncbi:MAG TPA: TniQ family protein [Opitutaceae bacterium]